MMLYSCIYMATVGAKGLSFLAVCGGHPATAANVQDDRIYCMLHI